MTISNNTPKNVTPLKFISRIEIDGVEAAPKPSKADLKTRFEAEGFEIIPSHNGSIHAVPKLTFGDYLALEAKKVLDKAVGNGALLTDGALVVVDKTVNWDGGGAPKPNNVADLQRAAMDAMKPGAPSSFEERAERVIGDRAAVVEEAAKLGLDLKTKDVVYTEGDLVNDIGVENAKASKREWDNQKTVVEVHNEYYAIIESEQRTDEATLLSKVAMNKAGKVRLESWQVGDPFIDINKTSFFQLCERAKFEKSTAMANHIWFNLKDDKEFAALSFNHMMKKKLTLEQINAEARAEAAKWVDEENQRRIDAAMAKKTTVVCVTAEESENLFLKKRDALVNENTAVARLRRKPNGHQEMYATVSPGYTPIDPREITQLITQAVSDLGIEARAKLDYDVETTRGQFDVTFHSDVAPEDYACGEMFKFGLRAKWSDVVGAVTISLFLWRNLCLNLIILDVAEIDVGKIIHAGSYESRLDLIKEAIKKVLTVGAPVIQKWGKARRTVIENPKPFIRVSKKAIRNADIDSVGKAWELCTIEEKVAGVVQGFVVQNYLPAIPKKDLIGIAETYKTDQTYVVGAPITVADVLNAVTKHAQYNCNPWDADERERAAGGILWNIDEVKPQFQHVSVHSL